MLKLSDLAVRPDFRAGALAISPSRRLVEGPAGALNIEPLIMQVFLLLLDARGQVVTRSELFDQCWGGVMVGDDSLNRAIGKVRRIGAETAPGHFEIETIPRTGYRLTGEILDCCEEDSTASGQTDTGPKFSRRAAMVGSAATLAAAAGGLGLWWSSRDHRDARAAALVEEADQILRYEFSERRLSAIPVLEEALAIQPDDPAILGMLAYARAIAVTSVRPGRVDEIRTADRAVKAALDADKDDPHARLALLLFRRGGFEWAATEDDLLAIRKDAPRNTLAMGWLVGLYQASGRNRLSWDVNEQLIQIDPISPAPQYRRALKHWIYGRTAEAERVSDRLIHIWPRHPWVWNARFLILAFTGRAHAALDMIDDAANRPATITPSRMAQWRPTLAALESPTPSARAAARDANLAAARQSPGQAAYGIMALGGIGEIDAAYEVAEGFLLSRGKIITRRPSDVSNMLVNNPTWRHTQWMWTPPMAGFRADRRFSGLCDGIGLTDYWRERGIRPDAPTLS